MVLLKQSNRSIPAEQELLTNKRLKAWLGDEIYFMKQKKRRVKNDSTQKNKKRQESDERFTLNFEHTHTQSSKEVESTL